MSDIKSITDQDFESEVSSAEVPVLVDFWATWCGPCKALAPKLEEISKEFADKVKVVKMDVDKNTETAARFGVRGIPTVIIFKGGKMIDQVVGNQPKDVLENLINKAL